MLNNIDLYKLRLLSDLNTTGSVSRTAENLNVTPSAVSQMVKQIEQQLGKQLYIRVGKTMRSTPLTVELCRLTQDYFSKLADVIETAAFGIEEIRIGSPTLFGSSILTSAICSYATDQARVRISVSLKDTQQIIESLVQGKFEFAFVDETPALKQFPEIVTKPCYQEKLVLCASKEFLQKYRLPKRATLAALKNCPHILYHKGKEGMYKWYAHHFGRVPPLQSTLAFDHPLAVRKAILLNRGVGVLPANSLAENEQSENFVVIDGPKEALTNKVQLAQLKERVPSTKEKELIKFLFAALSQN